MTSIHSVCWSRIASCALALLATLSTATVSRAQIIPGNLTLNDHSVTTFSLAGPVENVDYLTLDVTGTLTLAGALNVHLTHGFDPQDGNSFELLQWHTLIGQFNTLNLPPLDPGLSWNAIDLYTTGTISIVPEPPGIVLVATGLIVLIASSWRRRQGPSRGDWQTAE